MSTSSRPRRIVDLSPHPPATAAAHGAVWALFTQGERLSLPGEESAFLRLIPYLAERLLAEVAYPPLIQHIEITGINAAVRLHNDLSLTAPQQALHCPTASRFTRSSNSLTLR